jgi:hypothetical protein
MEKQQHSSISGTAHTRGYEILVLGVLDDRWSEWFQGMVMSKTCIGDRQLVTTITCHSNDQAHLRGILNKVWDLNLSLISVNQLRDPNAGNRRAKDDDVPG